jgi:hypothetical protein
MSATYAAYVDYIAKTACLYFGIPLLVAGTIGNVLIIVVFLSLRTFRQNSCAFYLTVMSLVNIFQLLTGLLARIVTTGFNLDWTQTSLFFCKLRYFIFPASSLISFTCLCLATIDQYFATCSRPRWQQWSSIKLAQRLSVFFILLWTLHGIPYLILFDQTRTPGSDKVICLSSSVPFAQYRLYVISLVLTGFFPVCFTIIFGTLAFYNVRNMVYRTRPLVRRELDKQLTTMVLTQDVINFFTVLPFSIMLALSSNSSLTSDPDIAIKIRLASNITLLLYYVYFGVSVHCSTRC